MSSLDPVERAILWPVVYASIFGAPIRRSKLWSQMVGTSASEEEMAHALSRPALGSFLCSDADLVWLRTKDGTDPRDLFTRRERATGELLARNAPVLDFVRGLPRVRLAALSGGCAHDAAEDGDIDCFVVTERGALWRTLLWATLVSKVRGWRRILCLNYLVDDTAQALPWRDFYGGFELISLKPLQGDAAFSELLRANDWVAPMFPNFFHSRVQGQNGGNENPTASRGRLLEATARMIQRPYLRLRLPRSTGVELSDRVVRLHATDHRGRLRGLFQDALHKIGMEAPPWI